MISDAGTEGFKREPDMSSIFPCHGLSMLPSQSRVADSNAKRGTEIASKCWCACVGCTTEKGGGGDSTTILSRHDNNEGSIGFALVAGIGVQSCNGRRGGGPAYCELPLDPGG